MHRRAKNGAKMTLVVEMRRLRAVAFLCLLVAVSLLHSSGRYASAAAGVDTLRLSIEEAVHLALLRNEDVRIAAATLEKARGRKVEAYSAALPSITAQAGYTRNILRPVIFFPNPETDEIMKIEIGEKNEFLANIILQQPLYAFGRIGGAIQIADYFLKSSEKDFSSARERVILEVKEAYYRVLLAERALEISRDALGQARRHFDETMLKFRQQVAARFDSIRAAVAVKNVEPSVTQAKNALTIALLDLKRITGIDESTVLVLTDSLRYEHYAYGLEDAIEEAISKRPDVEAMRLRVAMAEKVLQVRRRSNFPFLSLVGNYVLQGQQSDRLFPSRDRWAQSLGVGLSLSFPIFDGLANRGKVRQAEADLRIMHYTLEKMEKAVRLQVSQLYRQLEAYVENLRSQEATVEMAEEAYRLALVRYRNGLSTSLELSDAEFALTQARLNYLQAVYDCMIARERLENAIGYDIDHGSEDR